MSGQILLIEDSTLDAELTMHALEQCGVKNQVVHISDGADAIAALASREGQTLEHDLALVLVDVNLPTVDGFGVVKHFRSTPELQHVPVVVLTAAPLDADRIRASLLGATTYLPKTLEFRDYTHLLGTVVRPLL